MFKNTKLLLLFIVFESHRQFQTTQRMWGRITLDNFQRKCLPTKGSNRCFFFSSHIFWGSNRCPTKSSQPTPTPTQTTPRKPTSIQPRLLPATTNAPNTHHRRGRGCGILLRIGPHGIDKSKVHRRCPSRGGWDLHISRLVPVVFFSDEKFGQGWNKIVGKLIMQ